ILVNCQDNKPKEGCVFVGSNNLVKGKGVELDKNSKQVLDDSNKFSFEAIFRNSNLLLKKNYKTSTNYKELVGMEGPTIYKLGDKISSVTYTKTMKLYNRKERADKSEVGTLKENSYKSNDWNVWVAHLLKDILLNQRKERLKICGVYKYLKGLGGSMTLVIKKIQTLARSFAPVQQIEQGDNIVKTGPREYSISEVYEKRLEKAWNKFADTCVNVDSNGISFLVRDVR
ncbi:34270_t:CDS:2, partial [Gigaspora margarita]